MDIKTLKNFVTVAETGSILKAANVLHMSQPPLSKQMQALEKELNAVLFVRTARGVKLTGKGERLYKKALSLISYSESIYSELQEAAADVIHIGLITSVTQYALELICEYGESHNVDFSITEKDSFEQIKMLEKGILDLVMARKPFEVSNEIRAVKLFEDKLFVVGKHQLFTAEDSELYLRELSHISLITTKRWFNHINLYHSESLPVNFKYVCEDNRTAVSMAARGVGLAIIPGSVVDAYVDKTTFTWKPLADDMMNTDMYLLYNKKFGTGPAVNDFINYILENVEQRLNTKEEL